RRRQGLHGLSQQQGRSETLPRLLRPENGQEFWKQPIAGDIITAPVVKAGKVYLATLEGTLYCFQRKDGALAWKEKKNATSAPVVWNNKCYFSRRQETTLA